MHDQCMHSGWTVHALFINSECTVHKQWILSLEVNNYGLKKKKKKLRVCKRKRSIQTAPKSWGTVLFGNVQAYSGGEGREKMKGSRVGFSFSQFGCFYLFFKS